LYNKPSRGEKNKTTLQYARWDFTRVGLGKGDHIDRRTGIHTNINLKKPNSTVIFTWSCLSALWSHFRNTSICMQKATIFERQILLWLLYKIRISWANYISICCFKNYSNLKLGTPCENTTSWVDLSQKNNSLVTFHYLLVIQNSDEK